MIGATYSLAKGDPPGEVLLVTGISLLAGLFVVALSSGFAVPAWLVAAGASGVSAGAGMVVKSFVDPEETAREKLLRLSERVNPGAMELGK